MRHCSCSSPLFLRGFAAVSSSLQERRHAPASNKNHTPFQPDQLLWRLAPRRSTNKDRMPWFLRRRAGGGAGAGGAGPHQPLALLPEAPAPPPLSLQQLVRMLLVSGCAPVWGDGRALKTNCFPSVSLKLKTDRGSFSGACLLFTQSCRPLLFDPRQSHMHNITAPGVGGRRVPPAGVVRGRRQRR